MYKTKASLAKKFIMHAYMPSTAEREEIKDKVLPLSWALLFGANE